MLLVAEIPYSVGGRYALLDATAMRLGFEHAKLWEPDDYSSIFIPGDSHWNDRGHELIADVVVDVVQRDDIGDHRSEDWD